ncbi:hypothetical protein FACS1894195_2160 [Bacteroidia bacterium]|nr:hypothetical protein FACS1894195_2160 [Bacteroidia bacterium]
MHIMETTVKKKTTKVSAMQAAIDRRMKEGKPLSAIAKYWLAGNPDDWKINDMRAVLR